LGLATRIDIEDKDARASVHHFEVQPVDVGHNEVVSGPPAVSIPKAEAGVHAELSLTSWVLLFARTQRRHFCLAAEIAPNAVKEVFSFVVNPSFTVSAPFSANTFVAPQKVASKSCPY
jgi:hypothetical protein